MDEVSIEALAADYSDDVGGAVPIDFRGASKPVPGDAPATPVSSVRFHSHQRRFCDPNLLLADDTGPGSAGGQAFEAVLNFRAGGTAFGFEFPGGAGGPDVAWGDELGCPTRRV